ncbi:hypothetical protein ACPPVT_14340 [Angustibacter sp. McL0619]|uniref:hypothetical protein n=1 Tax=Angustibacter sp. McL0619 TaxID=3415676 RepID=UPI003CEB7C27
MGESTLLTTDIDVLTAAIIDECAAATVEVIVDQMWSERREVARPADPDPDGSMPPLELLIHAPVTGAAQMLDRKNLYTSAGTYPLGPGKQGWRVSMGLTLGEVSESDSSEVELGLQRVIAEWRTKLLDGAAKANIEVDAHRETARLAVRDILSQRSARLRLVHAAIAAADVRLSPSDTPQLVQLSPRALSLERVEKLAESGASEYRLAVDIADSLVAQIQAFGKALERSPVTADRVAGADEQSLRDVLLFILNANWSGQATGETFVNRGKSDILLRWRDRDAFIAECKIWDGASKFREGVDQLLDRYVVWRDTRVAMILFIRDTKNVSAAIREAHKVLESHPSTLGCPTSTADVAEPRDFTLNSPNDKRRAIKLTLIAVVIPRQ